MNTTPDSNNTPPSNEPPENDQTTEGAEGTEPPEGGSPGSLIGGEAATGEDEASGEAPAPAPEPLTADALELPEGFTPDDEAMGQFLELANDAGLDAEKANNLIGIHTKMMEHVATDMQQRWDQTQADWQAKSREEFGANLDHTLQNIAKVLDQYGDAEAREAFLVTGAGNHPAVVRLLAKIAQDVNERPPVSGAPSTAPADRATRMFGQKE